MKNAQIGVGLLAAVCVVCGPVFAVSGVPHSPLTASTSCSNYSGGTYGPMTTPYGAPTTATVAGSIPIYSLLPTLDNPVTSWPVAGAYDFCAAFDTTSCSLSPLEDLLGSYYWPYSAMFLCSTDINGPVDSNSTGLAALTGNGIPDGEFELGLLAAVLNGTYALDPAKTGGITNEQVLTAFKANYDYFRVLVTTGLANVPMKMDVRALFSALCGPYLHTGLTMVYAGYATEGDTQTLAALNELLVRMEVSNVQLPPGGVGAYTTGFASILGPDGDADGDGYSNRQEYDYFKSQGAAMTIAAQLNPDIAPPPPITGGIIINDKLPITTNPQATLALAWSGGAGTGVARMRFSDDGAHWTAWEPLKATRAYPLPGPDGYKTVRVQFLDRLNNRSAVFSDYILLDTVAPTGSIVINNGASTTINPSVTLGLNWSDGTGAGVSRMRFSDDGAHWTPWEPQAPTRAYTLPLPNGYHTVRVQYRDAVGNFSPVFNDYIRLQMP